MAGLIDISGFISPVINKILDFIPDPVAKAQAQAAAQAEAMNFIAQQNAAQSATNTAEASNSSLFVAGWRPFIGWIGGCGLGWSFIGQPVVANILVAAGYDASHMPKLDDGDLMVLVTGLLGLGAARSYEKVNGVAPKGAS